MASDSSTQDILRIVLIGKTGSGKSLTGNTIIGDKRFPLAFAFDSKTCRMQCEEVVRFDKKIIVVDTPGIYDTREGVSIEDTLTEIKKAFIFLTPGPHAIIFVVNGCAKYGMEERNTANLFAQYLGEDMLSHLFVIFTGRDQIERNGTTIDRMIERSEQQELKTLVENCKGRYFCFDNYSSNENQVEELIVEISKNVRRNGGKHYSSKLFKDIEEILKKEGTIPEHAEELSKGYFVTNSVKLPEGDSAAQPADAQDGYPITPMTILKVVTAPIWGPLYFLGKLVNFF